MTNASDILFKPHKGVKYIFWVPGEAKSHLSSRVRQSTIQFIPTRHEQAAGSWPPRLAVIGNPELSLP
jgi:thiamine pyrophosphate-dependent acetolactate synthase large subunit-like protein